MLGIYVKIPLNVRLLQPNVVGINLQCLDVRYIHLKSGETKSVKIWSINTERMISILLSHFVSVILHQAAILDKIIYNNLKHFYLISRKI